MNVRLSGYSSLISRTGRKVMLFERAQDINPTSAAAFSGLKLKGGYRLHHHEDRGFI